jgi:ABC-type molybdate transport system substrate-binding protein
MRADAAGRQQPGGSIRVFAAGSLKAAFGDIAAAVAEAGGPDVAFVFGAAGLLRGRIASGEPCDVFASANTAHPRALAGVGRQVFVFARNRLCALVQADLGATAENLVERMLDPAIRVGTSTPGADPSGDYALEFFAKVEQVERGAGQLLKNKALPLTGGEESSRPPTNGRSIYSFVMEGGSADIFLTYVTNALAVVRDTPGVVMVALPTELQVAADYGLVVLSSRPEAGEVANWILSPTGQAILKRHGFERPTSTE